MLDCLTLYSYDSHFWPGFTCLRDVCAKWKYLFNFQENKSTVGPITFKSFDTAVKLFINYFLHYDSAERA